MPGKIGEYADSATLAHERDAFRHIAAVSLRDQPQRRLVLVGALEVYPEVDLTELASVLSGSSELLPLYDVQVRIVESGTTAGLAWITSRAASPTRAWMS